MKPIEEIISSLRIAMTDARQNESHFESWMILNEAICDAIDALAEQPAQDDPDLQDKDPELVKKQNIPKIGCVNHDCDKCKAQQQEPPNVPPARASKHWVGLTDEEYSQLHNGLYQHGKSLGWVVDQAEAKLREKNT